MAKKKESSSNKSCLSTLLVLAIIGCLVYYFWPGDNPPPPDDGTGQVSNPKTETITVNGVSFKMVRIKGGTITMRSFVNCTSGDDKPAHQVTLSDYFIGQTEVTQALWQAVMGNNPSYFTPKNGIAENLNRPVETVSWDDCQTFITKLNQMTGKHFRLPTEDEWVFAARGGNKSKGYIYSGSNNINAVAWYRANSYDCGRNSPDFGTHAVATKAANELGLYDMTGNVSEWCDDLNGYYQRIGEETRPHRVYHGGFWASDGWAVYYFGHHESSSTNKNAEFGFRLAL